ncbi:ATP-binding protein [Undibacterium sp. TJN25]|uniref:ATP-binding protein n=1 Tax=Undibacterium sp. TJN25 TaxID=3413056 RepID=UPI003BF0599F
MPGISSLRIPALLTSLKSRITVFVVLIVLAATVAIIAVSQQVLRQRMRDTIGVEQFARLSGIASGIDQKFESRAMLLQMLAQQIAASDAGEPARMQAHLARFPVLRQVFRHIEVLDLDGGLIANYNSTAVIGRVNVKDRQYFIDTVAGNRAVISKPILNRVNKQPEVIMTQPVRDADGAIAYVISAGISLHEPAFLGEFANMKFGETGYMFIVNTDGTVVDHPNKARLLQKENSDGVRNSATAQALAGFEGSTEARNRYGVDGLYSFKRIKSTDWIIGSIYPKQEAFATVRMVQAKALVASVVLALAAGVLVWLATRSQLVPLLKLHGHMKKVRESHLYVPLQLKHKHDEIGDLGVAFDDLMQDRNAAEARQAESEQRLRTITDNLPAQIAYLDLEGRYLFANAFLAAVAGVPVAELLGRTMREVRGYAVHAAVAPYIARALAGETVTFQAEGQWQGNIYIYESIYVPAKGQDGAVCGLYAMTFDITDRKKVERIKNEFVSTVSHELRTPLTSINGSLGLVLAGVVGEVSPKIRELMEVAHRNVERLIRMINEMLDLEKIESGSMTFDIRLRDLVRLVEQAVDSSRAYALQYGVSIRFDVKPAQVQSYVDQDRFTQVMINLLSNAVKFSDAGSAVDVSLAVKAGVIRIEIVDSGCGIPVEFYGKIFNKFSQADGSNIRKKGGSGLGLSICKPLIEKMGGSIGFTSQLEVGSTFYIELAAAAA